MKARMLAAGNAVRERGFWVALLGTAVVLIALAAWTGREALERAAAWREHAAAVARTEALAARWARQLAPASTAEARAWAGSAAAVEAGGIEPGDRVALLQAVAERAEAAGLRDLALNFVTADTVPGRAPRRVDGRVFRPAPYALSLQATTRTPALLRLLATLPSQVEVARVDAVAVPEGVQTRLLLLVFVADDRRRGDGD